MLGYRFCLIFAIMILSIHLIHTQRGDHMRLEQFAYLVSIDTLSTIQAVADKYHITPSAVSMSLTALENELGIALVTRDRHGTRLTNAGREVVDGTKAFLELIHITQAKSQYAHLDGVFNYPTINTHGLLLNVSSLFESYLSKIAPKVIFNIFSYRNYQEQLDDVVIGKTSFALTYFLDDHIPSSEQFTFEPFIRGRLYCQIHKKFLKSKPKFLSINTVQNYPFSLLDFELCQNDPFTALILEHNKPVRIFFAKEYTQHLQRVALGVAVGFIWLPDFEPAPASSTLYTIPIDTDLDMQYGLLYRTEAPPTGFNCDVLSLFKMFIATL